MIASRQSAKNSTGKLLSPEQARMLSEHITKETQWNESDGIKTQTYSKGQRFGSSKPMPEFPLWANMVAKKLYYEKATNFFPDEVTVFEHGSVINVCKDIDKSSDKIFSLVLESLEKDRLMTILFKKN